MRFCFIIEEEYRNDPMPTVVADQLTQWGHEIDLLEPKEHLTCLTDLLQEDYDAYVLKPIANGPGLSILEAAEAIGIPTINNSRAIRLVRDKAVAAAFARAHGIPIPPTYFVAHPRLLAQIPAAEYPLVVKPSNGSSCQNIYRLNTPADLSQIDDLSGPNIQFLLAQHYAENDGFDLKIYVTGPEVYAAVVRKSPLHGEVRESFIPLSPSLRRLALDIGALFGLDIYGIDMVETPQGIVVLDINDFPSFGGVPRAVVRIAEYILHAAKRAEIRRLARASRKIRRSFIVQQHPYVAREEHLPMTQVPSTEQQTVCLIVDNPETSSHPVIGSLAERLRSLYSVRLLNLHACTSEQALAYEQAETPANLYLLKAHSRAALDLAHSLEEQGSLIVNTWGASNACQDRVQMTNLLNNAHLPWPATTHYPSVRDAIRHLTLNNQTHFPLIVKSQFSYRGDLVTRIHNLNDLISLQNRWDQEPIIIQEMVENDGWDLKFWVIDQYVFAARRRTPLNGSKEKENLPLDMETMPQEWREMVRQIGQVFGLLLYGVDLLETPQGPVIVDVNAFPGFRGMPDADSRLLDLVESMTKKGLVLA